MPKISFNVSIACSIPIIPGKTPSTPGLRAVRNGLRWRRLGKKTAIAWAAQMRREHRCLSLKAEYRAVDIRLTRKNTDIVRQISRRKIIRSINDHVVAGHKLRRVFTGETALVQFDLDLRIDVVQAIAGRLQLAATDVFCSVKNLALKIRKIDIVKIYNADCPNAGGCQIKRGRRSESSGADAQDARSFESTLPLGCNLGHDEMTRVALQFFNVQVHRAAAFVVNDAPIHMQPVHLAQSLGAVAGIGDAVKPNPLLARSASPESIGATILRYLSYSVTFTGVPTGAFS